MLAVVVNVGADVGDVIVTVGEVVMTVTLPVA